MPKFQRCLDNNQYAAKIRKSLEEGQKSFFLGLTEGSGTQVKAVRIIRGAQSYASFKQAIDGLLTEQK